MTKCKIQSHIELIVQIAISRKKLPAEKGPWDQPQRLIDEVVNASVDGSPQENTDKKEIPMYLVQICEDKIVSYRTVTLLYYLEKITLCQEKIIFKSFQMTIQISTHHH